MATVKQRKDVYQNWQRLSGISVDDQPQPLVYMNEEFYWMNDDEEDECDPDEICNDTSAEIVVVGAVPKKTRKKIQIIPIEDSDEFESLENDLNNEEHFFEEEEEDPATVLQTANNREEADDMEPDDFFFDTDMIDSLERKIFDRIQSAMKSSA